MAILGHILKFYRIFLKKVLQQFSLDSLHKNVICVTFGKIHGQRWFLVKILVILLNFGDFSDFPYISRFWKKSHFFALFANSRASGSAKSGPRSVTESRGPDRLHYKRGDLGARRKGSKLIPFGMLRMPHSNLSG